MPHARCDSTRQSSETKLQEVIQVNTYTPVSAVARAATKRCARGGDTAAFLVNGLKGINESDSLGRGSHGECRAEDGEEVLELHVDF